jgi:hypothetical protein
MAESDDLRTFIRELLLRFDRGMDAVYANLAAVREEQRAAREESRRYFEAIRAEQKADREKLDEILAEGHAGRQALFKVLDRLDEGPATAG